MKTRFYTLIFIAFLLITNSAYSQPWVKLMNDTSTNFYEVQKAFNTYWEGKKIEKGKGWKQFKRWENFWTPRVYPTGEMNHAADIWTAYQELKKVQSLKKEPSSAYWTSLGPVDIPGNGGGAGRINCVAFYPGNPDIIWAGSPSGGLWKSTDGGTNWSTNTDLLPNIGVSGIAIDPLQPDIMYIATGDGDAGDTYTIGVLKSTDGGQTWNTTGLTYNVSQLKSIRRLIIHPSNTSTLFAATNSGIFRTLDAGATWSMVRSGNFFDIEFKPDDPSFIWGATGSRVYKSENSGDSFVLCSAFAPSDIGRLSIAVTANDPNYLYILGGNNIDNGLGGVWKTTDLGATFTLCADYPNMLGWTEDGTDSGGQAWYDLSIAASPTNKNIAFVGGVNIWKTSDGGNNWSLNAHWYGGGGKPYVHADIHAIEFVPGSGTNIYAGCDGGVFKTTTTGSSWADKSSTLSIGQLYRLGCSATDPDLVMTGWQDNGSNLYESSYWSQVIGGDGMECLIDYSNPNYLYGELYYGDIYRSNDGGNSWDGISWDIDEEGDWITPYVQDPLAPATLYAGFENLWKTTNRGNSWTKVSDLVGGIKITAIAVAPSNTDIIYICRGSSILRSEDGGVTFSTASNGLPSLAPTYIAVNPEDPNVLWVTLSGYYADLKVFNSRDGGISWTNYTENSLPNVPANTIVMETASDEGLYVGTDLGVFYRDSTMTDWVSYNTGLPNVVIDELEIHYGSSKLRAATYGRGLWESDLYSVVGIDDTSSGGHSALNIFPNPVDEKISVELPLLMQNENPRMIIYNNIGAIVYSEEVSGKSGKVISCATDKIASGLYVIKIKTTGKTFSGTFIKN